MRCLRPTGLALVVGCAAFSEGKTTAEDGGTVTVDAGTADVDNDGGVSGDGAAASKCEITNFCDDFERAQPDGFLWNSVFMDVNSTLNISSAQSTSPTRSLHVLLEANGTDGRRALLRREINPASPGYNVSFMLRIQTRPVSGDIMIAELITGTGHVFVLLREANLVALGQSQPENVSGKQIEVPIADGWQKVVFDYRTLAGAIELTVAGQTSSTTVTQGGGLVNALEIGSAYATAGPHAELFIDDVQLARRD